VEPSRTFGFGMGATYQVIPAMASWVMSGHFDRFPNLKLLCVEAGAGWAPYIAHRLDEKYEMFGYAEKMEYWAFMWGTVVMAVSGLLLWAQNWSLRRFPTWVLDAATAAHWYEAILATLSILVWHWYLVIFDPDVYPMDLAWLTGKASADHLRETRPEYYRQLMEKGNPKGGSDAGDDSGQ